MIKLEYKKVVGINDKTTLSDAREYGALFGNELRFCVAENDWIPVFQFFWDANVLNELGPFIHKLNECKTVDDAAMNMHLCGWMKHSLPSFTMIHSMLETLLGDPVVIQGAHAEYEEQIRKFMKMTGKPESTELLGLCSFLFTARALHDFIAYTIFFSGDPTTFRQNITTKAARAIEKGSMRKNPGAIVIMFFSAVDMYLKMANRIFIPRYDEYVTACKKEAEAKRLAAKASKTEKGTNTQPRFKSASDCKENGKTAFADNGFSTSPFEILKRCSK